MHLRTLISLRDPLFNSLNLKLRKLVFIKYLLPMCFPTCSTSHELTAFNFHFSRGEQSVFDSIKHFIQYHINPTKTIMHLAELFFFTI